MTSRADREALAMERELDRAEHVAALASGPTCMCETCGGEGNENAGYEDQHECRACFGTGAQPLECVHPCAPSPPPSDADSPDPEDADAKAYLRRRAFLTAVAAHEVRR